MKKIGLCFSFLTSDYIVFFLAIRVKKFLNNMQFVMLSRSSLVLFTNRKLWHSANCGKTFFKLEYEERDFQIP